MDDKQIRMGGNKPYRNLIAWPKSMDLAVKIYGITKDFPRDEIYGLNGQLQRAAVSAPSNIAESAADRTTQQVFNFLSNSIGSLNEVDTHLELVLRLGYVPKNDYDRI